MTIAPLKIGFTPDEFTACHHLGREIALHLLGRAEARAIDMASLA